MQLDLRQAEHWQFDTSPDVLIIPSKLQPLAKDVLGALVVNPGQLVKGTGGGTYASIHINPISEVEIRKYGDSLQAEEGEQLKLPSVVTRSHVKIIRI